MTRWSRFLGFAALVALGSSGSARLDQGAAQAAIDRAFVSVARGRTINDIRAKIVGITEHPADNSAIADLDVVDTGLQGCAWRTGKALFNHYNDGRWALSSLQLFSPNFLCNSLPVNLNILVVANYKTEILGKWRADVKPETYFEYTVNGKYYEYWYNNGKTTVQMEGTYTVDGGFVITEVRNSTGRLLTYRRPFAVIDHILLDGQRLIGCPPASCDLSKPFPTEFQARMNAAAAKFYGY